jgi:N-methylhydantoinase A
VDRAVRGRRPVCFEPDEGYLDTPVVWRTDLGAGDAFRGPAIVEEFGSTIPVHPGFEVVVDDWANLVIRKESAR